MASTDLLVELHQGLPRQGPGSPEDTRRALGLVPDLPQRPRIVDLGCGSGASTMTLLEATDGSVVAVDLARPFLDDLVERAGSTGLRDRLEVVQSDIAEVPNAEVKPAWFHLVWSEAAAYAIGFETALSRWRHLLVPGGFIGVSELSWKGPVEHAPSRAREFFDREYPEMRSDEDNRRRFEAAGYELSGCYFEPAEAWWAYYGPLRERLPAFEAAHRGDPEAEALVAATREEIEVFETSEDSYGYAFYVGRMR